MAQLIHGTWQAFLPYVADNGVDLTITDIPYDECNDRADGQGGLRDLDKGHADDKTFELPPFVDEVVRVTKGSIYVCCGYEQVSDLVKLFRAKKLSVRVGVYAKTNPSPMNGTRLWTSGLELIVFARKPLATFNERCQLPIWYAPSGRKGKVIKTIKPQLLARRLVLASSNEGDTVLDCCMGEGWSGLAAVALGRNFIGVDSDRPTWDAAMDAFYPNRASHGESEG